MNDLLIRCKYKIGCLKYIAIESKENNELLVPVQVYLSEVQVNATPYGTDTIKTNVKYKVSKNGKSKWVEENEIYNSKEEIYEKMNIVSDKNAEYNKEKCTYQVILKDFPYGLCKKQKYCPPVICPTNYLECPVYNNENNK